MYISDNYDLFDQHEAEQEKQLRKKPFCCKCKDHIQQDTAVKINGFWWCDECLEGSMEEIEEW